MLTLVVPLRVTHAAGRSLRRLDRLLRTAPPEFHVVVVDDTAAPARRAEVAATVARRPLARHLHHAETAQEPFSIGRLRDAGAEAAPDGIILFHDVDFFAPRPVYRRLAAAFDAAGLSHEPHAFACAPVAFLSRLGTQVARMAPRRIWPTLPRPRAERIGLVDRVVLCSSAIALHRRTLLDAGGHDPVFHGHGAEDFELMHRLSQRYPKGARPLDYHRDHGSRAAAETGFRAYFARYGAPMLEAGLWLAHAWHPPRREDRRYYAARERNFALLCRMLQESQSADRAA